MHLYPFNNIYVISNIHTVFKLEYPYYDMSLIKATEEGKSTYDSILKLVLQRARIKSMSTAPDI